MSGATTAGAATSVAAGETALLLAILDQAYDHASWHGTNLRGSIRRVTREAGCMATRPGPSQYLGAHRSRRLLEVRGMAPPDRSDARLLSDQGVQLVSAAGGEADNRSRMAVRSAFARPDARSTASGCDSAVASGTEAHATRHQVQ